MKAFILFSYALILIVSFLIFLSLQIIIRSKKKHAGKIQAQWSAFLNLSNPLSLLVLIFILAYFLWCIYQIALDPGASDGHNRLMILVFFLGFTPAGNVYIGSEGIIIHLTFIPWKNVEEKKITHRRNRRYLEIRGPFHSSSKIETKRIPFPKGIRLDNL